MAPTGMISWPERLAWCPVNGCADCDRDTPRRDANGTRDRRRDRAGTARRLLGLHGIRTRVDATAGAELGRCPQARSRSRTGPSSAVAATSPPRSSPSCSWATSGSSPGGLEHVSRMTEVTLREGENLAGSHAEHQCRPALLVMKRPVSPIPLPAPVPFGRPCLR